MNWGIPAKDYGNASLGNDFATAIQVYFHFAPPDEEPDREWTDDDGAGRIRAQNDFGATGPDQLKLDATTMQPSATGTIPVKDRYDFLQCKFAGGAKAKCS